MKRYVIIVCLALLSIYQYLKVAQLKEHETDNMIAMSDTIHYYINKLNTETASVKTFKFDKLQLEKSLLERDKQLASLASDFTKLNYLTKYASAAIIDTIRVNFKDSIPFAFERSGMVSNLWYRFKYTSTQKSLEIDSLSLNTETTILTGVKRKWFLGPETLTTDITNTNPYIYVSKIKSAEISLSQPWYKKWYIWMAAGVIGGWLTAK